MSTGINEHGQNIETAEL